MQKSVAFLGANNELEKKKKERKFKKPIPFTTVPQGPREIVTGGKALISHIAKLSLIPGVSYDTLSTATSDFWLCPLTSPIQFVSQMPEYCQ